ncbi:MAG TPA: CGGC domain-containing protein [Clostridia bacterium]|nr:CGGC domain-containing protein [Clostridia bacterium]
MKKVGIIRCRQTEDLCPGTSCFKVTKEGKQAFEETGPVEVVGFVSCGGCPGKRAVSRAKLLVDKGAEIIALASCLGLGKPLSFPCPHFEAIASATKKKLGPEITVLEWTH